MENTLKETLQSVGKIINENPEPLKGLKAVYQFEIQGEEPFQLYLEAGQAKVVYSSTPQADCTLSMSEDSFYKFLTGKISGIQAFMTGKLKIKGDISKAMKLESLLKQYKF